MSGESKKVDFDGLASEAIAECSAIASGGDLSGALEKLLTAEKKCRIGGDAAATAKLAVEIVTLCWNAKDLKSLNAHILIISKRRAQLNKPVTEMVKTVAEWLDDIPDLEAREEVINSLRTVTEGKIYVEVERARLTKRLAAMREAEGKIKEASEVLQEVQVETYGSMEKREKAEFILEQTRLCIAQRDFVRAYIIAKKISKKVLAEDGFEEVRVRYYRLLIQLHQHQRDPMALARDYEAIYNTKTVQASRSQWMDALRHVVLFLVLAPFDNEQNDFMLKLKTDKKLEELPTYSALLKHMTTDLITPWPLPEDSTVSPHLAAVDADGKWAEDLHKRVVQHNVRVVAQCYSRIRLSRFAKLLGLDDDALETFVSEMVSAKLTWARIDRPDGIVNFVRPKDPTEVLSAWASDIGECLSLVEKTTHLINRERMVHANRA